MIVVVRVIIYTDSYADVNIKKATPFGMAMVYIY